MRETFVMWFLVLVDLTQIAYPLLYVKIIKKSRELIPERIYLVRNFLKIVVLIYMHGTLN